MRISKFVILVAVLSATVPAEVLPFVSDDYAKARDEAQQRKLPLFVEVWAPW